MEYLRVGTNYYRIINSSFINQDDETISFKELIPWKPREIARDFGNEFFNTDVAKFVTKHSLPQDILELYNKLPKGQRWLGE